jgi:hypothetical protein
MAVTSSFKRGKRDKVARHPTEVVATVYFHEFDGRKTLQIDTHGSDDRQMPD